MGEFKKFIRYNKIIAMIFGIVCICLVLSYKALGETIEDAVILVSIGILTALVTSLFFSWTVKNENAESLKKICKDIKSSDKKIENMVKTIELYHNQIVDNAVLNNSGVLSIRDKVYPQNQGQYWIDLLDSANKELYILGRTINTWFNEQYKKAFVGKILQMAKSNQVVKIVLQGPAYSNLKKPKMTAEEKKMLDTYCNLRSIYSLIADENKHCLQVHLIPKNINICYAYIKTDRSCYVSTYMYNHENEAKSFWIEFKNDSSYTGMFVSDFNNMIKEHDKIDLGAIDADIKKNSN